jgi:beta-galactosidase/beta-glucuronidase
MIDCISRMRGHPSLLLWCGSNEDAPQENTGKALIPGLAKGEHQIQLGGLKKTLVY